MGMELARLSAVKPNGKDDLMTILNADDVFAAYWATALEDAQFNENENACEHEREPDDIDGDPATEYAEKYMNAVKAVCKEAEPLLAELNLNEYPKGQGDNSISEVFGGDLYLTAVGHGAGFWDGDWGEIGDALTDITKRHMPGGDLAEHINGGYFFL